jgi:hypothetical protein
MTKEEQIAEIQGKLKPIQDTLSQAQGLGYSGNQEIQYGANNNMLPVGELYGGTTVDPIDSVYNAQLNNAGVKMDANGNVISSAPSQSDIYNNTLKMFQSEIDALDRLYATKKSELTTSLAKKSEGELGGQRAIMAGAGMLGQVSGFSNEQNLRTEQGERLSSGINSLDAEMESKKATLLGSVREMAMNEYNAKQTAYSGGLKSALDYLNNKETKTTSNISNAVKIALLNGIDLSTDKNYLSQIAKQLGTDSKKVLDAYTVAKSEYDAQQAEAQQEALKNQATLEKTQSETAQNIAQTAKLDYERTHPEVKTDTYEDANGNLILYDISTGKQIKNLGKVAVSGAGTGTGTTENVNALKDTITSIDSFLTDVSRGSVVNKSWTTGLMPRSWERMPSNQKNLIAGIEQMISTGTLNTLIQAKKEGATFGALSDKELGILGASFSKIKTWEMTDDKGKVLGYSIDQKSFDDEMKRIKESTQRLIDSLGGEVSNASNIITAPDGTQVEIID